MQKITRFIASIIATALIEFEMTTNDWEIIKKKVDDYIKQDLILTEKKEENKK